MKISSSWSAASKLLFRITMNFRRLLPKKRCEAFGSLRHEGEHTIEKIFAINLNRQPDRLAQIKLELQRILDWSGLELTEMLERHPAVDAKDFIREPIKDANIDPIYTLADQLFVEPHPKTFPTQLDLSLQIQMSRPEIAVGLSHIEIWQKVAVSDYKYVLILEDDVWFTTKFVQTLNHAWKEIAALKESESNFDIFYLSYEEVKNGAPKTFVSSNVFRPVRGLWQLSGYVISREGAKRLLQILPCRGPIDLWINHQFEVLNVLAVKKSIIKQRPDVSSTNSYSILPMLTKIGAITSEGPSLFHFHPGRSPVFAFGPDGSGLSSLAMALSMLGYRCCSDLQTLPKSELEMLHSRSNDRTFNAYVNIKSLATEATVLIKTYPEAKFIFTTKTGVIDEIDRKIIDALKDIDYLILHLETPNKWQPICEYLHCPPPVCSFPELADKGQRSILDNATKTNSLLKCALAKHDNSPWIVQSRRHWHGIHSISKDEMSSIGTMPFEINDCLENLDEKLWQLRDDTFTGNLALFRPNNINLLTGHGAKLSINKESLGVREYGAAALTTRNQYLFGRFEAVIKASNVPGVVTGFFLHRDSPRQEIDIEIAGNRTDRLLVNVFYNPGGEGAKFDYGYRGSPCYLNLGFDASESYHHYAIEWDSSEIRWFVDHRLVYSRVDWDPTPIPHLPMYLHINVWPTRSKELAGNLVKRRLPAATFVKSIRLKANQKLNIL